MHHLIGLGSCLCLSLHHSISSVITHMPQRGGRPDNGRLKGPWARQRGAAVCHRGNTASSPNYPSTALGKTQWGVLEGGEKEFWQLRPRPILFQNTQTHTYAWKKKNQLSYELREWWCKLRQFAVHVVCLVNVQQYASVTWKRSHTLLALLRSSFPEICQNLHSPSQMFWSNPKRSSVQSVMWLWGIWGSPLCTYIALHHIVSNCTA